MPDKESIKVGLQARRGFPVIHSAQQAVTIVFGIGVQGELQVLPPSGLTATYGADRDEWHIDGAYGPQHWETVATIGRSPESDIQQDTARRQWIPCLPPSNDLGYASRKNVCRACKRH